MVIKIKNRYAVSITRIKVAIVPQETPKGVFINEEGDVAHAACVEAYCTMLFVYAENANAARAMAEELTKSTKTPDEFQGTAINVLSTQNPTYSDIQEICEAADERRLNLNLG